MADQALIEYVIGMQGAGMTDSEIISRLRDEGYSAKEINDAMNKAKVKMAIAAAPEAEVAEARGEEMKPSITEEVPVPTPAPPMPAPVPQAPVPSREKKPAYEYAEAYPTYPAPPAYPYTYPAEAAAPPTPPSKVETEYIQELAEEIINEKWRDFRKKIGPIEEFKTDIEKRTSAVEEKIAKIEEMMNKMQISILGKIQEYGRSVESIGSEVRAIESNIGKVLDPLVTNVRELSKMTSQLKKGKNDK